MALTATLYLGDDDANAGGHARSARRALRAAATVRAATAPYDALVHDISATGCLVECGANLPVGTPLSIGISGIGRVDARVARRDGAQAGCIFDRALSPVELEIAGTVDTVLPLASDQIVATAAPDEAVDRWSARTRLGVLAAGVALTWTAVGVCIALA